MVKRMHLNYSIFPRSLKFFSTLLQPYKYLLATRMLDYGYHLRSLMYMEQVSLHIEKDVSKYEATFINRVSTKS